MRERQESEPVSQVQLWDGLPAWLITDYALGRQVLGDPRTSADATRPNFPHPDPGMKTRFENATGLLVMDDPDHATLRKTVTPRFSVRRIEATRPTVQRVVDELIDKMLAGPKPVDLVSALALPLPAALIAEVLGASPEHGDFFQEKTAVLASSTAPPEEVLAAMGALTTYFKELMGQRKLDPQDDLVSDMAVVHIPAGTLTLEEAADILMGLLLGGYETTANMIAMGTALLLQNPDQLAMLQENDDPKFVAGAVEELLRFLTIVHWGRRRIAAEDMEVGGILIKAGDRIVVAAEIANRDPKVFTNPDELDLTRDARRHITFGFGVHQCLGQPLARIELQVVYSTLYRRIPTMKLAIPREQLVFKNHNVYGLEALPITW